MQNTVKPRRHKETKKYECSLTAEAQREGDKLRWAEHVPPLRKAVLQLRGETITTFDPTKLDLVIRARVKGITEAIAHEVDAQHGQQDK